MTLTRAYEIVSGANFRVADNPGAANRWAKLTASITSGWPTSRPVTGGIAGF